MMPIEPPRRKPVLVLQNLAGDGPAYLGTWLARHGVAYEVVDASAGRAFPDRIEPYAALAILGGEMSANDPLPSLRQAERLILDAMAQGRPVIGHCLGGQLMARALGARVVPSPAPEVGWQPMRVLPGETAEHWFGPADHATVFHWHAEAFELPAGADALATSDACPVQAFAIGPHLAMQFHLEIDEAKLLRWSQAHGALYRSQQASHPATVQPGSAMRAGIAAHLDAHHRWADRIYGRWLGAAADFASHAQLAAS